MGEKVVCKNQAGLHCLCLPSFPPAVDTAPYSHSQSPYPYSMPTLTTCLPYKEKKEKKDSWPWNSVYAFPWNDPL